MSALPAFPVATGEHRALTVYAAPPEGCGTIPVPDDAFAPHLKAGELAVIDPDDREPAAGEIYVVKISRPREDCGYRLAIVQLRPSRGRIVDPSDPDGEGEVGWSMHFQISRPQPALKLYATPEEAARNVSAFTICDGPFAADGIRNKTVGRVIGVMLSR